MHIRIYIYIYIHIYTRAHRHAREEQAPGVPGLLGPRGQAATPEALRVQEQIRTSYCYYAAPYGGI